jgi:hypothetical protein
MSGAAEERRPLPIRNAMHYDGRVFERVNWSQRGAYMQRKHGVAPAIADEALEDPNRVVIDPDYNSESGRSVRIIGFSVTAGDVITVIVLENDGTEYGVNGWTANEKDRRFYAAGSEGEADEQRD